MVTKLSESRNELSGWNEKLKEEVLQQTEAIQKMQSGMARADKLASIGQITAGVMHEVGNPLTAIKMKIQVAQEDDESTNQKELLVEILKEVDRLANFLHFFSRYSRLNDNYVFEEVDLNEGCESIVSFLSADLLRKGINLNFVSDSNLPLIRGRKDKLRQVLMNLIINARDASKSGSEVRVKTSSQLDEHGDPSVIIEIQDFGEGIPPEILTKIWKPFFTSKEEGTGLGLAICKKIIRDFEGDIKIESEQGVGTTVKVVFFERSIVKLSNEDRDSECINSNS